MEDTSIANPIRLIKASSKINQKFTNPKTLYFLALTSSQSKQYKWKSN